MKIAHPNPVMTKTRIRRDTPPTPPPFGPEQIAGAIGVWVASDIAQSNGSLVSSWVDRVSGKTLVQANGAKQPDYITAGINGHPSVRFNAGGGSELLHLPAALSVASSGSVILVLIDEFKSQAIPWSTGNESVANRYLFSFYNTAGNFDVEFANAGVGDTNRQGNNNMVQNGIYETEVQSLDTEYAFRRDGVLLSEAGGADTGMWFGDITGANGFTIGCWKNNTENSFSFFRGHIGCVIVIDGIMSAPDRALLNTWITANFGITMP